MGQDQIFAFNIIHLAKIDMLIKKKKMSKTTDQLNKKGKNLKSVKPAIGSVNKRDWIYLFKKVSEI